MSPATARDPARPFPHDGGCPDCYAAFRCNVCGEPTTLYTGRCTNGRCPDCHRSVCTTGGETSEGHGYGTPPGPAP